MSAPTEPVSRQHSGKVVLLSAGPGDLELLTLKAVKRLADADVLLLDELVDAGICAFAPRARVIRVGKRGHRPSTRQDSILRLMRRCAHLGLCVVRVKGGEALLFGRAGEEIAHLTEHGIAFEIVNGVSSGFAAAASLGLSLTHRDHCQGVSFVTACSRDGSEPDWAALAATGTTLVIYMGMKRIESLAAALNRHLPPTTPAAIVEWACTARERRALTRLDRLAETAAREGFASPSVILVGDAIGEAFPRRISDPSIPSRRFQ